MKFLTFAGIGIVALWLQLTLAPMMSVFGYKPDLLLLSVVVIGLRWLEPWLFLYAVFAGLAKDVFSHGALGVYGISFFGVSFLARFVGISVYENSLLLGMASVFGLSLAEGMVALTLFDLLESSVPWWHWLLTDIFPTAVVNALWSPLLFYGFARLERWVRPSEA
ncbi:MAG TPA: rod shape-determining protein MreD [bacterium]|nr:rod shape-determining protein MreD [bacterium]